MNKSSIMIMAENAEGNDVATKVASIDYCRDLKDTHLGGLDEKKTNQLYRQIADGQEFPDEAFADVKDEIRDAYQSAWDHLSEIYNESVVIEANRVKQKDADKEAKTKAAADKKAKAEEEKAKREEAAAAEKSRIEEAGAVIISQTQDTTTASDATAGAISAWQGNALPEGFTVDPSNGKTTIPADATKEDLIRVITGAGGMSQGMEKGSDMLKWLIGDACVAYQDTYGSSFEKAMEETNAYELLGLKKDTVRRLPTVCRMFPPAVRYVGLTFTHYNEAGRKGPDAKNEPERYAEFFGELKDLLKATKKNGWNMKTLREKAKAISDSYTGKEPAAPVVPLAFFLIDPDGDAFVAEKGDHELSVAEIGQMKQDGWKFIPVGNKRLIQDQDGDQTMRTVKGGSIELDPVEEEG